MKFSACWLLIAALAPAQSMRGYTESQAATEQANEHKAQALPQPNLIRSYMERMAQQPHHAGSPMDASPWHNMRWGSSRSFGLDAHIEDFEALIPYPTTRVLELIEPMQYRIVLKEPAIAGILDTAELGQLPTYNAYSARAT